MNRANKIERKNKGKKTAETREKKRETHMIARVRKRERKRERKKNERAPYVPICSRRQW
jgi:hypothetical protein